MFFLATSFGVNPADWAELWLTNNIFASLNEILKNILDYFSNIINNEFLITTYINDTQQVKTVVNFTVALAYMLLVATTVKQLIDIYGLHTTGDSNESPLEVVYRASVSSVLIAGSELFYTEFFKFTSRLGKDITMATSGETITDKCNSWMGMENAIAGVLMTLVIVIAIVIFFVIASIRGAQVMLFRVLFPIFAIDRSFTNKDRWNKFLQSYVGCFIGFTVQLLCFGMFRSTFMQVGNGNLATTATIASFGWLIMAIKSPKWLDQYVFKSGMGEGLSRSLSQAGSILMMRAV